MGGLSTGGNIMKRNLLGLVILALLLFVPLMAHAATAGKFISVEGNVDVTSPGKEARPANLGDLLNVGDIIRTKSKSKCEVEFQDGSILRLGENSRLRVNEFAQEKGERNATLELFRGKIQNVVTAVKGSVGQSKYEIQTSTAVCGVRGTDFFVYHQGGVTGAAFREGSGYGYSRNRPGDVRPIEAGQAMTVSNPNVPPVVRPATASEMNQHQKDTAPSEKPKSEAKKEEEKRSEGVAARTDEGKKEEQKNGEAKPAETSAPAASGEQSKPADTFAQSMEMPTSEALSLLSAATAPLSTPTTTNLTSGSSAIVVPIADTTPPKITRLTPDTFSDVTKLTSQSGATFTVEFDEKATISYSLDGSSYVTAAGDKLILTSLPEGSNTVSVKGIDSAGNISPATTYTWKTDYTAPTITLSGTPAAITNASAATIGVSASEQATYAYTLNGATVASPTLTNLPAGSNTFTVTATDPAGNAATKTYAWTTDYTAPTITLSGTPAAITNASNATIGVSASEQATYAYALNGAPVSSPTLTNLPAGSNTFTVTATDPAGNSSTKTYAWTTDYTAPGLTINTPQASPGTGSTTDVKVTLTGNESVTFASTLDTGNPPISGSSLDLKGLSSGDHSLNVEAKDEAGNITTQSLSFTLSRYTLDGNSNIGSATAEVANVSDKDWGSWKLNPPSASVLYAGGGSDTAGFWIVPPAKTLTYLTTAFLGSGTADNGGTARYSQSPLDFSGKFQWGGFGNINTLGQLTFDSTSNISGIVGSTSSLWNNMQSVAIGRYSNLNFNPVWDMDIGGTTGLTLANTSDRGAFYLSGGGIALGNAIEGKAAGLYIKPDGQGGYLAGYLSTDLFTVATYPDISMWEASPTITASAGVSTTVLPSELYWDGPKLKVSQLNNLPISGSLTGFSNMEFLRLIDQNWGRWMSWSGGSYTTLPTTTSNWKAVIGGEVRSPITLSTLSWLTPQGLTNAPEVVVNGNSIIMGVSNTTETGSSQRVSLHGASALLPSGAIGYKVTFDYNLSTWDAYSITSGYQPNGQPTMGRGWYDSFSVSSSKDKFWNLSLTDPLKTDPNLNVGFLWGGTSYGDTYLETISGTKSVFLSNFGGNAYLNVYLDTATAPYADSGYPSWGTVTVTNVEAITGYQISKITGTQWSDNKLTGTVDGKYLTTTTLGTMKGDLLGTYNTKDNTWQAVSLGAWNETPLAFGGQSSYGLFWQYTPLSPGDSLGYGGSMGYGGAMAGLIGSTTSLFGGFDSALKTYTAVDLKGLGIYDSASKPLFLAQFNDVNATTSNGNFLFFGGATLLSTEGTPAALAGNMQGLYWKDAGGGNYELGTLSSVSGAGATLYPTLVNPMWELDAGTTLQAYSLITGAGTPPGVTNSILDSTMPAYYLSPYYGNPITEWEPVAAGGSWKEWARYENAMTFSDPSRLSVAAELSGGGYEAATPPQSGDKWNQVWEIACGDCYSSGIKYLGTEITGVDASNNVFNGQAVSATINWKDDVNGGWTSVGGGTIKGSFDPITATWRAAALMTGMETAAFVNKVSSMMTDAQRQAFFDATKIPCFTVGTTDLKASTIAGTSGNTIDMTGSYGINNVGFYAPSTGGKPQIWASGNVSGGYTGYPNGVTVPLTGSNGINAQFNMQQWGTTKWGATVTNGNVPANSLTGATGFTKTNAVSFQGGAAGTITGSTFSGTAAGTVKQAPPQILAY
jgi:hypothetical protein